MTTTTNEAKAAERLRRHYAGEPDEAVYGEDDCESSFLIRDTQMVAEAYLAQSPTYEELVAKIQRLEAVCNWIIERHDLSNSYSMTPYKAIVNDFAEASRMATVALKHIPTPHEARSLTSTTRRLWMQSG